MPFKVGISGNPSGRPAGSKNKATLKRQELNELILKHGEKIVHKAVAIALDGDVAMIKFLLDKIIPSGRFQYSSQDVAVEFDVELFNKAQKIINDDFCI